MSSPQESLPVTYPANVLAAYIDNRARELSGLLDDFDEGLTIVSDMSQVNEIIALSPRPDLAMSEPVEVLPISSPKELGKISGFKSFVQSSGMDVYDQRENNQTGAIQTRFVGKRPYTTDERACVFLLGARGGYDEREALLKEHTIDARLASELLWGNHLSDKGAFMRMWILLPGLTNKLMNACLDEPDKSVKEELFVAYTLMSRLVDAADRLVVSSDGTVDDQYLCH
jgi:hypothetical protein